MCLIWTTVSSIETTSMETFLHHGLLFPLKFCKYLAAIFPNIIFVNNLWFLWIDKPTIYMYMQDIHRQQFNGTIAWMDWRHEEPWWIVRINVLRYISFLFICERTKIYFNCYLLISLTHYFPYLLALFLKILREQLVQWPSSKFYRQPFFTN